METVDRNRPLTRVERKVLRAISSLPEQRRQILNLREQLHRSLVRLQHELDALGADAEVK